MFKKTYLYMLLSLLCLTKAIGQEETPFVAYDVPSQNLLKFNRFLINPTFSTARENKSYINLLHRNQSVTFNDNNQAYFLSYSGRVNDRSGLGLSLYTQRQGLISNYGVMANYAYGIKLSDKSNFTFGANLSYYNSGFDRNRVNALDPNDPALNGLQDSNLLSFQPGFNISYGKFDVGVFAENLFDYNLKTSTILTEFADKTYSGHVQYTHQFKNENGVFEEGRLMPLVRVRKIGEEKVILGGSLVLDLPKLGWLQGGYDQFYGASAGIGFNINRRLSLGYTMEKGLSNNFDNFGLTHEISFAYSITPTLTEDRVMLEEGYEEELAENVEEPKETLNAQQLEIEKLKKALAENDAILAELLYRQDSMEINRQKDLERRFEMVMKMVREETKGNRLDIEEKAKKMYLVNNENGGLINNSIASKNKPNSILSATKTKDAITSKKTENKKLQNDEFTRVAQQNNIKSRKFKNLEGVADGYYVVANVYKGEKYLNKFIENLANKGVTAGYFENPNNGLKYVYLEKYATWQDALAAHKSNIGGAYAKDMWIMNVDNSSANDVNNTYVNNVNKIKKISSEYTTDKVANNVVVKDNVTANNPTVKTYKMNGLGSGYYIIANVFENVNNANRFVKMLNAQGFNASYFINPKNNYRYVFLKRHESWNNALVSYYSKLNDTYTAKMWIMHIKSQSVA